jgi:septal ring factor EnvC (AmiA/AmiB activator)
MWKSQRKWLFLLLACSLWLLAGSTSRAEGMYQISESELTTLEQNLHRLEKNNESKQQLLTEQKAQLTEANQQLEIAKVQLEESRRLNDRTLKSLESANRSLQVLENEAKRKIRVKTRQRNLWIGVSAALLYAYISQ